MIWIKRALQLAMGGLVAMFLLLALVYISFDESDYRHSLVWIADHVFDSELQIDGPLSLQLSRQLRFSAEDVTLQARDDSFRYSSESLSLDIQLDHLLSGTLWINNIVISRLNLRVNETREHTLDWRDIRIPSIIVARADIDQLVVEYQELPPGTLHRVALDSLQLDDVNDRGPISIKAGGEFEGKTFTLAGQLPAIADVLAHNKASPLDIVLSSDTAHLSLAGTVIDPTTGEGLDLQLSIDKADSSVLLEWLGDDIPELGEFSMTAHLLGDYETPRLEGISASLNRNGKVAVSVAGSVTDLYSVDGLDITVESHAQQPLLLSWLLFDSPDKLASLDLKGRLQRHDDRLLISGLKADVTAHTGLALTMTGDAEIYPAGHALGPSDSSLEVTFNMPSSSALDVFDIGPLPDFAATSGQFRLVAGMDALAVYDADVRIRSRHTDATRLQGRIGNIPLQDDLFASDIDLQARIGTTHVRAFAARFGKAFADISSGEAQLRVSGRTNNLRLSKLKLQAGYTTGLQITASGQINRLNPAAPLQSAEAQLKLTARAADLEDLSAIADVEWPGLGAVVMNSGLSLKQSTLKLEDVRIDVGRPDQPAIRLQGSAVTQLHKGSNIDIEYSVAVTDLVAAFTAQLPGYLGRLEGSAEISDIDGSWGIEHFSLQTRQTNLYSIEASGGFDDLKNSDEVNISIDLAVNDPASLGKALDINLAWLSAYRKQGHLSSTRDVISYHGDLSIGSTRGTTVIQGVKHRDHPTFRGSVSIPVLNLKDFGFAVEKEVEYQIDVSPGSGGKDELFSRRPLHFDFLNDFDLDIDIDIDEVDSYGRSSINSVNGHIKLNNGNLRIDPLRFDYANGILNMNLGLLAHQPPVLSMQVKADDLLLGPIMAQVTPGEPVQGRTNVNMDITAAGNSVHAMAAALNGVIRLEYENAKIPAWLINYLSVDVFGWVFSTAMPRQNHVTLNCIVAEFNASDGELNSKLLLADGPNLSVGGRVDLDLRDETLDAVLLPQQKRRLFSTITPVRLSGPIKSPTVLAIPVKAAIQEIGALTLSAPIYLSARFLEKIWGAIRSGSDVGKGCTEVDKMTDRAEAASKSE